MNFKFSLTKNSQKICSWFLSILKFGEKLKTYEDISLKVLSCLEEKKSLFLLSTSWHENLQNTLYLQAEKNILLSTYWHKRKWWISPKFGIQFWTRMVSVILTFKNMLHFLSIHNHQVRRGRKVVHIEKIRLRNQVGARASICFQHLLPAYFQTPLPL